MLIPTNSDRPVIKRFHEFVIEQNNGNTEASEQTLYLPNQRSKTSN